MQAAPAAGDAEGAALDWLDAHGSQLGQDSGAQLSGEDVAEKLGMLQQVLWRAGLLDAARAVSAGMNALLRGSTSGSSAAAHLQEQLAEHLEEARRQRRWEAQRAEPGAAQEQRPGQQLRVYRQGYV